MTSCLRGSAGRCELPGSYHHIVPRGSPIPPTRASILCGLDCSSSLSFCCCLGLHRLCFLPGHLFQPLADGETCFPGGTWCSSASSRSPAKLTPRGFPSSLDSISHNLHTLSAPLQIASAPLRQKEPSHLMVLPTPNSLRRPRSN